MTSPKAAFQKSPYAREFANIAESEAFAQAVRAALLQMQFLMPESPDPGLSHAYHQRMIGARHFAALLSRLCESEPPLPASSFGNLNHQA